MSVFSLSQEDTILVVDDTPTNLQVLFDLLSEQNYRVAIAKNGETALQRVQSSQPNLILLDVMMPGIDGFETCKRLKANPDTRDIPVIFIKINTGCGKLSDFSPEREATRGLQSPCSFLLLFLLKYCIMFEK